MQVLRMFVVGMRQNSGPSRNPFVCHGSPRARPDPGRLIGELHRQTDRYTDRQTCGPRRLLYKGICATFGPDAVWLISFARGTCVSYRYLGWLRSNLRSDVSVLLLILIAEITIGSGSPSHPSIRVYMVPGPMALPQKMDTPLIRCTMTPLKDPSERGTMWTKRTNADRSGAPESACKDISCPSRGSFSGANVPSRRQTPVRCGIPPDAGRRIW